MIVKDLSSCVVTNKIDETREFYVRHFGGKVIFDCGWYVNVRFEPDGRAMQFMAPQGGDQPLFGGTGLTFNFSVSDVDSEYARLRSEGLSPLSSPEDHPWGDRGFALADPNGVMLYLYQEIEPSPEFKKYFLE